jgi:hypothetical protein
MNTEHKNTMHARPTPDEAWDVFLPDGEGEPLPDEGDFWLEPYDDLEED